MVEGMMMECCLSSLSPLSPPLPSSSSTTTPFFLNRLHSRPSSILRVNSRLKNGLESDKRARLLEKYGLDPAEYMDTSTNDDFSSKGRKRKGKGRGMTATEKMVPPEEPKPPRTTHQLLQVLGGQARRKKLLSPKGADVRPMMAVVRGAAFDILQAAGGCPTSLRPGRWLDLYSGTGSVGIEAMSRGCCEAHFVEMDPWVVSEVLKPNLESTGFQDVSVIHTVQVEKFLENASRHPGKHECFDYVSVTPPYTAVSYDVLMDQLAQSPLVGEDTFVLVEYPSRTLMEESCGPLLKITDRRFGRTYFAIYGPLWSQKKRMS